LSTALPKKLTGPQLIKKFPPFYGTRKRFRPVPILSQTNSNSIHASPAQFLKIRFLLSYCLRLGLSSGPLPRPHSQEAGTLLLKSGQFTFFFSTPLLTQHSDHTTGWSVEKTCSISGRDNRFFPFEKNSDRLWGPP